MAESYSVTAMLSAVDKNFSSVFGRAEAASQSFGQKTGALTTAVGKSSMVMGAGLAYAASKAVSSYGTFDEAINKAAVIGGASNKSLKTDMKALSAEAQELGKTLPISSQEAGNAMVEMARNGASINNLKSEFPQIAKAAAVSGEELSGVATTVQNAMNIWGGGAKNAAKDSAILAKNANLSSLGIEDMGQVFANSGAMAKTLGFSITDLSAASGIMAKNNINAAQGSQDLAHALTLMAKPSDTAKAKMEELGISYTDTKGNFKSFPSILKEVASATDGLSKSQKVATLNTLFGAAGAKAMLPLLDSTQNKAKNGKSVWEDYADSLEKAGGSAKKANKYLSDNSENMTKNVGQQIDQTVDAFDSLFKASIADIAPQIMVVSEAIQNFVSNLTRSNSPMAKFTRGLIAWSPVIAGVLIVFGLLATGIGKLVTALSAPVNMFRTFTKSTSKAGRFSAMSAKQIAALGLKALGIGVGIGVAAAGIALLAFALTGLAKTGTAGIIAVVAITVAVAALALIFSKLAPSLTAGSAGLIAFSVAVLSASIGIALVVGSLTLLVMSITALANTGTAGTTAMIAFGVVIASLAVTFALLGPLLTASAVGLIAFAGAMLAISVSVLIASAGLVIIATVLPTISTYGLSASIGIAALALGFVALGLASVVLAVGLVAVSVPMILLVGLTAVLAVSLLAISVAALAVGVAIMVASAGMTLLASVMPLISQYGLSSAVAFAALGAASLVLGAGLLIAGAGATVAGAGLIVLGAGALIAAAGVTLLGAGIGIAAAGLSLFGAAALIAGPATAKLATGMLLLAPAILALSAGSTGLILAGTNMGIFAAAAKLASMGIKPLAGQISTTASSFRSLPSSISASKTALSGLTSAAKNNGTTMVSTSTQASSAIKTMNTSISGTLTTLKATFTSKMIAIKTVVKSGMTSAVTSVRNSRSSFKAAGEYASAGIASGILAQKGEVMEAAREVASAAAAEARKALKIHSPSRVMRDQVGVYIPAGIAVGMRNNIGAIASAANDMANAAMMEVPAPSVNDFNDSISQIQSLSSTAFRGDFNGSVSLEDTTVSQQNNALLRRIADKDTNLYMDSDTLVGTTSDKFNGQLGATSNNNERWGW